MPRFYFDFRQGEAHSPDQVGLDLATTEQAYLEGFKAAQEMWGTLLARREDPHRCRFEVLDGERRALFAIPFQEVLEACQDRRMVRAQWTTYREGVAGAVRARRVAQEFRDQLHAARRNLDEARRLLAIEI